MTIIRQQRARKHLPLRRAGDRARDARDWREASKLYGQYLELVPDEPRIWIQLGHACKEQGDFDKAETAYRSALAMLPEDADLQLQLGHLFKLQGRSGDAAESYARSLELNPTAMAYGELAGMGEISAANQVLDRSRRRLPPATYFYVSDLLSYLSDHKTPSGIQRVQLGIVDYINRLGQSPDGQYKFVTSGAAGDRLFLLDSQGLQAVVDYVARARVEHGVLRSLIQKVTAAIVPLALGPGDSFIVLGSFWGHGGLSDLLRTLKGRGVRIGIYFHDLIPITHPEFCDDRLSDEFTQAFVEAAYYADFGLTVSDYTRRELLRLLELNGFPRIPAKTVALAHGLGGSQSAPSADKEWSDAIRDLKGTRYVLFVSTIEIRKNHRFLLDVWKRLMNEGIDVPTLLFVGRPGWRVADLYGQLEATNYLDGKIKILHDLSDGDLSCLYRNCLFTTFPSVVEGWGLPIGESLSYGKLCVASGESSMPEVAGALTPYIDPLNTRAAMDVFRTLLTSPAEIESWEAKIAAGFHVRDWSAVAKDIMDATSTLIAALPEPPAPAFVPKMAAGDIFFAGIAGPATGKVSCDIRDRTQRLILLTYWCRPEESGTRMSGVEGSILVQTDVGPDRPVRGTLQILASDTLHDATLDIHAAGRPPQSHPLRAGTEHVIHFDARTDGDGALDIRLRASGPGKGLGKSAIALCSFAYTVAGDEAAWSSLLENALRFNVGRVTKKNSKTRA